MVSLLDNVLKSTDRVEYVLFGPKQHEFVRSHLMGYSHASCAFWPFSQVALQRLLSWISGPQIRRECRRCGVGFEVLLV